MIECIFVGVGGFIGAVLRYLMGKIPVNNGNGFPYVTMFINVIGAFCIGAIAVIATKNQMEKSNIILMLKVGVCGGFTTFSTFSLETFNLFQNGKVFLGLLYICMSVITCCMAVFVAYHIFK